MLKYYVYAYLRKDGTPYYIGKGQGNRAYVSCVGHRPPSNRQRIVFLETYLTEVGALALERRYIDWYGRKDLNNGILYNKTAGGEGTSNKSAATLLKMSVANKGKSPSAETRLKRSLSKKGKKQSAELSAKRAAAHLGMKRPKSFCNSRKGGGNPNSAPVTVNGTLYASITEAIDALGVSRYILKKMLCGN